MTIYSSDFVGTFKGGVLYSRKILRENIQKLYDLIYICILFQSAVDMFVPGAMDEKPEEEEEKKEEEAAVEVAPDEGAEKKKKKKKKKAAKQNHCITDTGKIGVYFIQS